MNGRFFLGVLLAFVAIFIWGALFWMNPIPNGMMKETGADTELQDLMREEMKEDGLYMLPSSHLEKAEMERLYARGPVAMVFYRSEGIEGMNAGSLVTSAVHDLLSVFLLGALMLMVRGSLPTYGKRVLFAGFAGFAMAFFSDLTGAVWFFQPWGWALYVLLYDVTIWIVAGLILGRFIGPAAVRETA